MQSRIVKAAWSVVRKPSRVAGRSIGTEIICRTVRGLFDDGQKNDLSWLRRKMNGAAVAHPAQKRVSTTNTEMAGVQCLRIQPESIGDDDNSISKVVVYFHGGGFVSGSPKGFAPLTAQFSDKAQVPVISVDYRLSPEHVFPAAQDDCCAVVKATQSQFPQAKIILGGDSAGGNLAISTAISLASDASARPVDALMLISPWVEPTADDGTMLSNVDSDVFESTFLQSSYEAHLGGADPYDDRVNFLGVDLSSLPKTYTQVGGAELFLDQVVNFDMRAKQQGVDAALDIYDAQFHDFQCFSPLLKDARNAIEKLASFIVSQ